MATLTTHVDGTVLTAAALNTNFSALNTEVRPVATGCTALASFTIGDLLTATAATTLASIVDVATGQVLTSGGVGVIPAWSAAPTISGIVTLSGTGPSLKLTAADAQILIGGATDPGWSVPAVQLFNSGGGAMYAVVSVGVRLGSNIYYDGAEKSQAGGASAAIRLTLTPDLQFLTAPTVAADAAYTFVERFRIDSNATAAETALLVSVAGAAVQRVSIGAVDSGGAGFRLMRVAN